MSEPVADPPPPGRRGPLNFTGWQFILFVGTGAVGLAALLAAGLGFGLALAGAATLAVVVLVVWVVAANLIGASPTRGDRQPRI